jgi:hypothetical protein
VASTRKLPENAGDPRLPSGITYTSESIAYLQTLTNLGLQARERICRWLVEQYSEEPDYKIELEEVQRELCRRNLKALN